MSKARRILLIIMLLLTPIVLSACSGRQAPFSEIPNPIATIALTDGQEMRFELFVTEAPNTVANFVELASAGFYNGQRFFRIVPGVLIQAGDPRNDGTGGASHAIQGEFSANGIDNKLSHARGTISMCRLEEYDSASSQFFILQGGYPEYDGNYAAFGRATDAKSLETIDMLASTPVDSAYSPVGAVPSIKSITVETNGYKFEAAKLEIKKEEK